MFFRSEDCPFKKVISLTCLMRMRMTHDFTKMIICTVEGYIMVIHDLDLTTLKEDLYDFQSDLYRLMQKVWLVLESVLIIFFIIIFFFFDQRNTAVVSILVLGKIRFFETKKIASNWSVIFQLKMKHIWLVL